MGVNRQFEHEFRFSSTVAEGRRIQKLVQEKLQDYSFSARAIFGIKLAVEEALLNAIKHGNRMDPSKEVRVGFTVDHEHFVIEIEDEGSGFELDDIPDPTASENRERSCGRGVFLMRSYMTECEFLPPGNVCRMRQTRE